MPLSIVIWLPLAVALVGALAPRALAPRIAALGAFATLGLTIGLVAGFDRGGGLQHVTDETWIPDLGIHYALGVDGLNVLLLLVTAALWAAVTLWLNFRPVDRPRLFFFHLALGETAVLGAFAAQDLALFVVFFDLMLVPFYFLTGMWGGGPDRVRATTKLVIYTLVGSLLMLAGAVAIGVLSEPTGGELDFRIATLARLGTLSESEQDVIFIAFAAAFLVKMPAFPFHGWLPDGYRAMPLPVLAVFSGVLSKVAAYGFLKIVLPILPSAAEQFQLLMLLLALASILYGSAMAFTTTDLRLVLGYSSVAQLGFIVLGIFSLREDGAQGALLQMVNHAIVVAPLFLVVALLAARAGGSEDLRDMGGLAFRAPVLAALFLIAALANLAMPGSSNFVGEFLILLGAFRESEAIAIVASIGVIAAAVYMLRAFIAAMHNRVGPRAESRELSARDGLVIAPLVACILALALYPQFGLAKSEEAVRAAVAGVAPIEETAQEPLP